MEINDFKKICFKITLLQFIIISGVSIILFFLGYKKDVTCALLITATFSSLYTVVLYLSSANKYLAFFGSPFRIMVIAIPIAILVHKLNLNLIALFLGLVFSQLIYFIVLFINLKKESQKT